MIITLIAVLHIKFAVGFFSAQNVFQYILDGTIQKAQTCVFYHMTNYDSIVLKILETCSNKCLKTIYLRKQKSVVFVASRC
jgi:hypothetical protein